MTDQVQESAPATPEIVEPAVPQVSEVVQEAQQPSVPSGITEDRLQELLAAQREALTEEFSRSLQSIKDRRIANLETKVDEALAIKQQVEAAGGWDQFLGQVQQSEALEKKLEKMLEARISGAAAPAAQADEKSAWQSEWRQESQKILDAAAKSGVSLSQEEYNAAMFNNGLAFGSKGDAYAALNRAILAKAKGEAIPIAAVATEGGNVAKPPAPPAGPKTSRQKFEEAKAANDEAAMRAALDEQWAAIDREQKLTVAQEALRAAGVSPEELLGQ